MTKRGKKNRRKPWLYDQIPYRQRHEVERLFRSLKGFGRNFTCFEKLDLMFAAFLNFAMIVDLLR